MRSLSRLSRLGPSPAGSSCLWLRRSFQSSIPQLSALARAQAFHSLPRRANAAARARGRRTPPSITQSLQIPQSRSLTTKPLPSHRGPLVRFVYRSFAYTGLFVVTCGAVVVAFFIYDASTYREADPLGDCPVSEVALSPKRGGPKNLPIANVLLDDEATAEFAAQKDKPKLVILGTGWGSVALLKSLVPGDYHVTVVSPVNYFLFTPMLPSATVGTLEFRSLVEPIRKIVNRLRGHFLQAEAENIEFSEKLVEVSQVDAEGNKQHFYLPYDKLVIGVG